jgi:hypothetical protein
MLTAWLLALTPPGLGNAGNSLDLGAKYRFQNASIGFDMSVEFSETVGANDVRIEVFSVPATGITGLAIDFNPPLGSTVNALTIHNLVLTEGNVAVLEKEDGFSLPVAGIWTIIVRIDSTIIQQQDVLVGPAD